MASPARTAVIGVSLAALGLGSGLASYAVVSTFGSKSATPHTTPSYVEKLPCDGCPAGISLDSVDVQERDGSTLFTVHGTWPASVDGLRSDVRLVANDVEVVLHPHGSQGAFEIVTANRGAGHPTGSALAAAIQGGALSINIAPALTPPVSFEFGLWDGKAYKGRLPRSGLLAWSGTNAAAPTHPTVAAPTDELTSLPGQCKSIPNATGVPTYLEPRGISSTPSEEDPRRHVATPKIGMVTAASALDATAPFAIVAVIGHPGDPTSVGQSRAIDRAGSEQLYLYFDGATKHKGVRSFAGGKWTLDTVAADLTFVLKDGGLSFYWTGLKVGDSFGFVTAAGGGCRSQGVPLGFPGGGRI